MFVGIPTPPSPSSPLFQDYPPGGGGTTRGGSRPARGEAASPVQGHSKWLPLDPGPPPPPYFFFFVLPFPSAFFGMGRGVRTTAHSLVSWLLRFLLSPPVSSSTSMSEEEAERLAPHDRPEGRPSAASPGPIAGPPPIPLDPSPGAPGGAKSPPGTGAPLSPFTPPPGPSPEPGEGGSAGCSREDRSSRFAPGGTGLHAEGHQACGWPGIPSPHRSGSAASSRTARSGDLPLRT